MAFTKEDGISVGLLAVVGGVVLPGFVTGYLLLSNYFHEQAEEERIAKTYDANRAQYKSVKGDAEAKLNTQFKSNPKLDKTGKQDSGTESITMAKININNAMDLVVEKQAEAKRKAAEAKIAADSGEENAPTEESAGEVKPSGDNQPSEGTDSEVSDKKDS